MNLLGRKNKSQSVQNGPLTVGICLTDRTAAFVACTSAEDDRPQIVAWDSVLLSEEVPLRVAVQRFVDQNGLRGCPCRVLLPAYDYSLRLVERPPNIPDEELPEAARWLIRDLVDFDIDQAQMAVLLLPQDDRRARTERIFVIAAREGPLVESAEAIRDAGLVLAGAEILETAMIALEARMPQTVAGHAVLWLNDKSSALTVSIDQTLLLARSLSIETDALDEAAGLAAEGTEEGARTAHDLLGPLLLEIQRSLDYYESESGAAPASQLTILPSAVDAGLLAPLMTEALRPLTVEAFDLVRHFEFDTAPSGGQEAEVLLAAGAACAPPDLLGSALVPHSFRGGPQGFGLDSVLRLAALVCVLMLGLYGWNRSELAREHEQLAAFEAESRTTQATVDRRLEEQAQRDARQDPAAEIDALEQVRDAGLRTLRDLNRGHSRSIVPFSQVLESLSRQDLDSIWLEEIELSAGGSEIELRGRTLAAADVPVFLRGLGREKSFETRRFRTLDFMQPGDGTTGLRFTLSTRAHAPEEPRP